MPASTKSRLSVVGPIALLAGATVGLIASLVLSYEAIVLAAESTKNLGCDLSAVLSCSVVAQQPSAALLGFPNSFIGLMAFPVLITVGVLLCSGVTLPKRIVNGLLIGMAAGLLFAGWMFFESFFNIKVLCPWCLTTDLGMLIAGYGVFHYGVRTTQSPQWLQRAKKFSQSNYDLVVLFSIIIIVAAAIIVAFGDELLG